jgi:hypothetical protein
VPVPRGANRVQFGQAEAAPVVLVGFPSAPGAGLCTLMPLRVMHFAARGMVVVESGPSPPQGGVTRASRRERPSSGVRTAGPLGWPCGALRGGQTVSATCSQVMSQGGNCGARHAPRGPRSARQRYLSIVHGSARYGGASSGRPETPRDLAERSRPQNHRSPLPDPSPSRQACHWPRWSGSRPCHPGVFDSVSPMARSLSSGLPVASSGWSTIVAVPRADSRAALAPRPLPRWSAVC